MAEQMTNYQCPACTGPLHFNGATGRLDVITAAVPILWMR